MVLYNSIDAVWIIMISEYLCSEGNFTVVKEFAVDEVALGLHLQHLVAHRPLLDFAGPLLGLAILGGQELHVDAALLHLPQVVRQHHSSPRFVRGGLEVVESCLEEVEFSRLMGGLVVEILHAFVVALALAGGLVGNAGVQVAEELRHLLVDAIGLPVLPRDLEEGELRAVVEGEQVIPPDVLRQEPVLGPEAPSCFLLGDSLCLHFDWYQRQLRKSLPLYRLLSQVRGVVLTVAKLLLLDCLLPRLLPLLGRHLLPHVPKFK